MLKYILAIIIFGVIIFIHEFGHFFVAKLCGIKVNKFALGMGPKILKKQIGETEYSLRLVSVRWKVKIRKAKTAVHSGINPYGKECLL